VTHMDAPRRIGKHFQDVVFRPRVVVARYEDATLVPDFLPARLGVAGVVAVVGHWICEYFLVRRGAMKDHGGSTIGLRAKTVNGSCTLRLFRRNAAQSAAKCAAKPQSAEVPDQRATACRIGIRSLRRCIKASRL